MVWLCSVIVPTSLAKFKGTKPTDNSKKHSTLMIPDV
uniref:Uncharacterized protein n=1 Tax=Arundo donax TaxID=35708 RepID=A0A0A9GJQ6_ARUDO